MKTELIDLKVEKVHRKCWKATFKIEMPEGVKPMDVEYTAITEERLNEKLNHLKETGIFLRD